MGLHGIARIHGKVDDHLFKLLRVGTDRAQFAVVAHGELDLVAHQALEQLTDLAHHVGQLEDHGAQSLLAAEGEQLAGQAGGAVGIGLDLLDIVVIAVTRRVAQEHEIAIADDGGQHIVEVMRDTACQLADGLHLGGLRNLAAQTLFLGGIGDREQHRRIAQPAHTGESDRHRLFLVAGKPHGHVAARRRALGEAAHGVGNGGLVLAHDEVGGELRQALLLALDRAQESLVGEQEAPVAVGQCQSQRQRRKQRFQLRDGRLPAALPATADADIAVDQQHQRRCLVGGCASIAVGLVERDVHQRLGRALLAFSRKEDAVAVVGPQELHEFLPHQRSALLAQSPLCEAGRGRLHDAVGRNQCKFDARGRQQSAERSGDTIRNAFLTLVVDPLAETPDEVILTAPDPLDLQGEAPIPCRGRQFVGFGRPFAPCLTRRIGEPLARRFVQRDFVRGALPAEPCLVSGICTHEPVGPVDDGNGPAPVLDRRSSHCPVGLGQLGCLLGRLKPCRQQ